MNRESVGHESSGLGVASLGGEGRKIADYRSSIICLSELLRAEGLSFTSITISTSPPSRPLGGIPVVSGSVGTGGPAGFHKLHADGDEGDQHYHYEDQVYVRPDPLIAPQPVPEQGNAGTPQKGPDRVEGNKGAVAHPGDPGRDRKERPDHRYEAGQDDRATPVLFKEAVGFVDVFTAHQPRVGFVKDRRSRPAADQVTSLVTDERAENAAAARNRMFTWTMPWIRAARQ